MTDKNYAPVTSASTIEPIPKNGLYRVKRNETLYSIAWRYGLDYRYLAKRNHIKPPYHTEPNQLIYLRGKPVKLETYPIQKVPLSLPAVSIKHLPKKMTTIAIMEKEPVSVVKHWHWPARGPVVGVFSSMNKGVNISGRLNDPIYATAAGKVVYSGNGLRGYGNLIIIKHNSSYLTAYADNNTVFVKSGDWVKAGQKIAGMGYSESQRAMLHFEIRRNGKPVNPLSYLEKIAK
jgi:lipoprotein NlpD